MNRIMMGIGIGGFSTSLVYLAIVGNKFSLASWVYLIFTGLILISALIIKAVKS